MSSSVGEIGSLAIQQDGDIGAPIGKASCCRKRTSSIVATPRKDGNATLLVRADEGRRLPRAGCRRSPSFGEASGRTLLLSDRPPASDRPRRRRPNLSGSRATSRQVAPPNPRRVQDLTTTVPFILGWTSHWKRYSPLRGEVNSYSTFVPPRMISPWKMGSFASASS